VVDVPFVDGVFIPDGRRGAVQISSAGHFFPDCPNTDNQTWAYVWAGGKLPKSMASLTPTLAGVDYSSAKHAILVMHANKGITFDLDAVRRAHSNAKVTRFLAMTGNFETRSDKNDEVLADVWVIVDGKVRFKRREINRYNGPNEVAVAICQGERFLTLAATDSGDTCRCDHIVFGDPRLELIEEDSAGNAK
jgi:hypothetical protein